MPQDVPRTPAPFFWLHVKKSAGITTRKLLAPHYVEVDRTRNPANFIQSDPAEWNDILNNFRVVLGEYQFHRTLFAKRFLYRERWDDLVSFAFAREPVDRCISAFFYLWYPSSPRERFRRHLALSMRARRPRFDVSYAFDQYLDLLDLARQSDTIFRPRGLHFRTHAAPMWHDVVDEAGRVLLTRVYRLENLHDGIDEVFQMCALPDRVDRSAGRENVTRGKAALTPTRRQRARIEELYAGDFELYETAR